MKIDRAPDFAVRAPIDGRLTWRGLDVGDAVENGKVIAAIDGVPLVAFRSEVVPYRDLTRGDRGPDVEAVSEFLVELGMLEREHASDSFGRSLERAVRAHQRELGVAVDGVFRSTSVAYVSPDATVVRELVKGVGEHVAVGESLVGLVSPASSVDVQAALDGDSLAALRNSAVTLVAGAASLDLAALPVAAAEVELVDRFVTDLVNLGVLAPTDEGASSYVGGELRLTQARARGTVPTRALFGARSGAVCVFVAPEKAGAEPRAHVLPDAPAAVGEVGTTLVPEQLIGAEVVGDPYRLPARVRDACE
ncbi:peptidoglycan-binding protein [Cellulomonas sp. GbtcB1]|uniref:peptidoglycan-binding domain-containing protein n=1 Tax=Cellulomonas sp. GbtcB1 TaxID=2824746 RepID=UPI001C2FD131|nr:peptidoglycan-binding domain-containing protein [Cellulomonas sp. GbtcB1]